MKKCPGCGTIVQDGDKCSVCGTDLFETRSEPLEELVKEEAARPRNEDDPHWKRNTLLPPLVFTGLGIGLILSGLILILYAPAPLSFVRWYGGLILVVVGFYVLLLMVIGGRESEVRGGMREEETEITNKISTSTEADVKIRMLRIFIETWASLDSDSPGTLFDWRMTRGITTTGFPLAVTLGLCHATSLEMMPTYPAELLVGFGSCVVQLPEKPSHISAYNEH